MADAVGGITFINIDTHPGRAEEEHVFVVNGGIDGTAIHETGKRGQPFSFGVKAIAANFDAARQKFRELSALRSGPPVEISFSTVAEPGHRYQITDVQPKPGRIRGIVFGHSAALGSYLGWMEAVVTALPIDTAVQPPV